MKRHDIPIIYFSDEKLEKELGLSLTKVNVSVSSSQTETKVIINEHTVLLPKLLRQSITIETLIQSLKEKGII
jgi:hypothetical protein